MIVPVFGTPTPMMYWGVNVVRSLLDAAKMPYDFVPASSLDALRDLWAERKSDNLIVVADVPTPDLADVFIRHEAPLLVLLDDLIESVGFIVEQRDIDIKAAIRTMSASLAAVHSAIESPGALIIRSGRLKGTAPLLRSIARHFGIPGTDPLVEKALIALGAEQPDGISSVASQMSVHVANCKPPGYWRSTLRKADIQLIEDTLFAIHASNNDATHWPIDILLNGENPNFPVPAQFDLTGPARYLTFGPYLHLPAGEWRASLQFNVEENLSGNEFLLDVTAGHFFRSWTCKLPREGHFETKCNFVVPDSSCPVEIRLRVNEGAIHGRLDVFGIDLTPWGRDP